MVRFFWFTTTSLQRNGPITILHQNLHLRGRRYQVPRRPVPRRPVPVVLAPVVVLLVAVALLRVLVVLVRVVLVRVRLPILLLVIIVSTAKGGMLLTVLEIWWKTTISRRT